jgi:membrane protease YdiL (CAAX protease family)
MKNPNTQSNGDIRKQLSKISLKKGFISILIPSIITIVIFLVLQDRLNLSDAWASLIFGYVLYTIPLALIIWVFRGTKYSITDFFKRDSAELSQISMVIPLLAMAVSVIWMIILVLNLIDVETAGSYLNWISNTEILGIGPETSLLQYLLFFGLIAILGPVVEEIIFRGIMIERLGAKYSYGWAVGISSVIFGLLHASPVGAFIVGVFLSLIYLKTESLTAPILVHIANNAFATFAIIADEKYSYGFGNWETVEPYITNAWIGILLFTLSSIWLGWYVIQNWQAIADRQPFTLEPEKIESSS